MMRKVPIVSTLVVLIAVAVMIALGVWQLQRKTEKEALIALYSAAPIEAGVIDYWDGADPAVAYRKVRGECIPIGEPQFVAGRSAQGQPGYVAAIPCRVLGFDWGGSYVLVLGWTPRPTSAKWERGEYVGTMVPTRKASVVQPEEKNTGYDNVEQMDFHVVADPALAGLEPLAKPDPRDLPNNHLSYAVQWFLFAITALVIYAFALRRRWRERS